MKLNFSFMKKGKPIYWIIGAIVIFVIFYLLASRGGSEEGDSSVSYVSTGPNPAQLAAQTQIAGAQIAANAQAAQIAGQVSIAQGEQSANVAIATLGLQSELAKTEAERTVALNALAADTATQLAAFNTQKAINEMNTEYAIESAEIAAETTIKTSQIQSDMFSKQLDTNRDMLKIQSQNLISQSLIAQIPTLKKKDRDQALAALAGVSYRGSTVMSPGVIPQ